MSKRMYHPCHKLSVPTAKLFWCRHCMQMFEDAITRWKHSRKCHALRGFRPKDQEAKVVQLYVKPDKVSYSSNITSGQAVYHKPHVKKTSTDLKCIICGTKFPSLYDMRKHVKEPCQKLENNYNCAENQLSDSEDDIESYSTLKIRRVEAEGEDDKVNSVNTALSVLAEASKHVESLYAGQVKFEQVIEEVPQDLVSISQPGGSSSNEDFVTGLPWFQLSDRTPDTDQRPVQQQQPAQEVVVAYPRPQVRPELGTIVISLQTEEGKLVDSIDLDTLQGYVKETASTLPIGQIIHIQIDSAEKYLEFVVGYQGFIWPLESYPTIADSSVQEQTPNTVLSRKAPSTLLTPAPVPAQKNTGEESEKRFELAVDVSLALPQEIVIASEGAVTNHEAHNNIKEISEGSEKVVQIDNSTGQSFGHTFYPVSIEQAEIVSSTDLPEGSQLVASVPIRNTIECAGVSQNSSESLVEALLKGSVILNPSVVPQHQAQITVVELSDQQFNNLTKSEPQPLHQASQFSVFTMASGEQLMEDLFGFAELTGEQVKSPPKEDASKEIADKKKIDELKKRSIDKDDIKRESDKVIVPIFFEKSGVKKYKVLARYQVEDDEDIKRPTSEERSSPNSEEQRKENINIERKIPLHQKVKSDIKKSVKKQTVKGLQKGEREHSLKKSKFGVNAKKSSSSKNEKIHNKEKIVRKLTKVESLSSCHSADPRAVSYEFNSDSDTNSKVIAPEVTVNADTKKDKECNIESNVCINSGEIESHEKEKEKQNPCKVKCLVKLKRDPSIDSLYKIVSESGSCDSFSNSVVECVEDTVNEVVNISKYDNASEANGDESKSVSRQTSEESRLKAVDMIYNADIQVRKSGRLKSAKCASRYRGDYGIRVDTYNQLVSQYSGACSSGNKVDIQESPCFQGSDSIIENNGSENCDDNKQQFNPNDFDVNSAVSEPKLENMDTIDMCKHSSEDFTALKSTDHSCSSSNISQKYIDTCEMNISAQDLNDTKRKNSGALQMNNGKVEDSCRSVDILHDCEKCQTEHQVEINRDIPRNVKEYETNESNLNAINVSAGSQIKCPKTEDLCNCTHNTEISDINELCDTQTECKNSENEVPCSNVILKCVQCEIKKSKNTESGIVAVQSSSDGDDIRITDTEADMAKPSPDLMQKSQSGSKNDKTRYVHSVGKSVNKIHKRIEIKKSVKDRSKETVDNDTVQDISPVKDAAQVLETLRQKLFESAGADVVEADKQPKLFESKLISSKQRLNMDSKSPAHSDISEKDCVRSDADSLLQRSGKSSPTALTPKLEAGFEILEEVAESLDNFKRTKCKPCNSNRPVKRQRFEEKIFLLRSMKDNTDNSAPKSSSYGSDTDNMVERMCNEAETNYSDNCIPGHTLITSNCPVETGCETIVKQKQTDNKIKHVSKPKPVWCSACSHMFKTKELLRKHFPCRIRQTRTWSQNKLRPNRAVKRVENSSKKFVCNLPKSVKQEASKPRPQLLTYRKTKFRRVKGKRRRRLYQQIQELKQKRVPVKWPHLSLVYEDLSFKEQCLYNLGLICVGNASEGLERYTAEDITLFEQHRAKERWLTEDRRTFEHSIPDMLKSLCDIGETTDVNTETSTDYPESDCFSPNSVINISQGQAEIAEENSIEILSLKNSCNSECRIEENSPETQILKDVSYSESSSQLAETNTEKTETSECKLVVTEAYESPSNKCKNVPWCESFIHALEEELEEETFKNDKVVNEISVQFEKSNAEVIIQECTDLVQPTASSPDLVSEPANISTDSMDQAMDTPEYTECQRLPTRVFENAIVTEKVRQIVADETLTPSKITVENHLENVKVTDLEIHSAKSDCDHVLDANLCSNVENSEENSLLESKSNDENTSTPKSSYCDNENIVFSNTDEFPSEDDSMMKKSVEVDDIDLKSELKSNIDEKQNSHESEQLPSSELMENNAHFQQCQDNNENRDENIYKDVSEDTERRNQEIKNDSSKSLETNETVTRSKESSFVPDIVSFHQATIIDDKVLSSSNVDRKSIELPSKGTKENETGKDSNQKENRIDFANSNSETTKKSLSYSSHLAVDTNIASEVGKVSPTLPLNESPRKGILKNAGASPIKSGKKKIDFKTYSKRKAMLNEEKEREKEHMRSEGHHVIEEGLLGRLLDAVNLIDSIIEEHKEHVEEEEFFSAITPEMAFEAAAHNSKFGSIDSDDNKADDITENKDGNMPYDIENIIPLVEDDNIVDEEQSTLQSEDHAEKEIEENNIDQILELQRPKDESIAIEMENNMIESNVQQVDSEVLDNPTVLEEKVNVPSENEMESDLSATTDVTRNDRGKQKSIEKNSNICTDVMQSGLTCNIDFKKSPPESNQDPYMKEVNGEDDMKLDLPENIDSIRSIDDTHTEECKTIQTSSKDIDSLETNIQTSPLSQRDSSSTPNEIISLSQDNEEAYTRSTMSEDDNLKDQIDVKDRLEQDMSGNSSNAIVKEIEENATRNDKMQSPDPENETLFENENNKADNYDHPESLFLEVLDDTNKKLQEDEELMKSPDMFPKRCKTGERKKIKESKGDFTIKYEMNGIVVKENLLTGDKNVVENSSPFKSSTDSDSNYDQSSQSEVDISLAENEDSSDAKRELGNSISSLDTAKVSGNENRSNSDFVEKTTETNDNETLEGTPSSLKDNSEIIQDIIKESETLPRENFHSHMDHSNTKSAEDITPSQTNLFSTFRTSSPLSQKDTTDTSVVCLEDTPELCQELLPLTGIETEVSRNQSDIQPIESPPVLEKVGVDIDDIVQLDEETFSESSEVCSLSSPPVLEPEDLKESEQDYDVECSFSETEDLKRNIQENDKESSETNKPKMRPERHFLDILENFSNAPENLTPAFHSNNEEGLELEDEDFEMKDTSQHLNKHMESNDSIERNSPDVAELPKTLKVSKLQFLFDESERGDITMAQIKNILSPKSKKGKDIAIPKESLLNIKSGIATLLSNVKKPSKQDLLKRDSPLVKKSNEDTGNDRLFEPTSVDVADYMCPNGEDTSEFKTNIDNQEHHMKIPSKSSVADTILQMLTSLEDKGNIADNMSNILDILADNLRFLGSGNNGERNVDSDTSDSDSDYDREVVVSHSSTEDMQKNMIADYLSEGEQPPSLDEIPVADTSTATLESPYHSEQNEEGEEQFLSEDESRVTYKSTASPVFEGSGTTCKIYSPSEGGEVDRNEANIQLKQVSDVEISGTDQVAGEKHKARTIFKSITELNSIETDEESNCEESYDPVSMSARLSELKVSPKVDLNWESNSYYDSELELDDLDSGETSNVLIQSPRNDLLHETSDNVEEKITKNNDKHTAKSSGLCEEIIVDISSHKSVHTSVTDILQQAESVTEDGLKESRINTTDQTSDNTCLDDQLGKIGVDKGQNDIKSSSVSCTLEMNNKQSSKSVMDNITIESDTEDDVIEEDSRILSCNENYQDDETKLNQSLVEHEGISEKETNSKGNQHLLSDNEDIISDTEEEQISYDLSVKKVVEEDEDTNDTIVYEERNAKDKKAKDKVSTTDLKSLTTENTLSLIKEKHTEEMVNLSKSESDLIGNADNKFDVNDNKAFSEICIEQESEDNRFHSDGDRFDQTVVENKTATKKRSSSCHISKSDYSDDYCETIAEKVKRNQRDRSKSVCYNFDPLLYYTAICDKELSKPVKKEASIFRTSILEKRAREKRVSPEKLEECSASKKRRDTNEYVSKFSSQGYSNSSLLSKNTENENMPKYPLQLKPCNVLLPKLTDEVIKQYTNRKRKSDIEFLPEKRPPIKVTIKLSQIVYPPNSPYGSTSVSSDANRSGYDSCSEESESDLNHDTDQQYDSEREMKTSSDRLEVKGSDRIGASGSCFDEREPLKIKMRTLLTKMNSYEAASDKPKAANKIDQSQKEIKKSSQKICTDKSTKQLKTENLNDSTKELKVGQSGEDSIMFYLSDSEGEDTLSSVQKFDGVWKNGESVKDNTSGKKKDSTTSDIAECGESDVDLSDSDTDSEIQEKIDEILNMSNNDEHSDRNKEQKNISKPCRDQKTRSGIMKMIVSDLRLSESESESDSEINSSPKQTKMQDKTICTDTEVSPELPCAGSNVLGVENQENNQQKVQLSQVELEHKAPKQKLANKKDKVVDNIFEALNFSNDFQEHVNSLSCSASENVDKSSVNEMKANTVLDKISPNLVDVENEKVVLIEECNYREDAVLQIPGVIVPSQIHSTASENDCEGAALKPQDNMQKFEESYDQVGMISDLDNDICNNSSLEKGTESCISGDVLKEQSNFEDFTYQQTPSLLDREKALTETTNSDIIEAESGIDTTEHTDLENAKYQHIPADRKTDNFTEEPNSLDNFTPKLKNSDNLITEPTCSIDASIAPINAGDRSESSTTDNVISEPNKSDDIVTSQSISGNDVNCPNLAQEDKEYVATFENVDSVNDPQVSKNSYTTIDNVGCKSETLSIEQEKEIENMNAVKNLEEDAFQEVEPVENEDMLYFAVELTDDLETSEAVVNLESVELIEGPVIVENNDDEERPDLVTATQAHITGQVQLQNELVNEQIVETFRDSNQYSEVKNNCAVESNEHFDDQLCYPVVTSKYLYGINEDSQSSTEVVEELVTDGIVNESQALQQVNVVVGPFPMETDDVPDKVEHELSVQNCESPICKRNFDSDVGPESSLPNSEKSLQSIISNNCETTEMWSDADNVQAEHVVEYSESTYKSSSQVHVDNDKNCEYGGETSTVQQSPPEYGQCGIMDCSDAEDFVITENELFDEESMDVT